MLKVHFHLLKSNQRIETISTLCLETYVQETQTKPEGQIHFFPVIFNGKQVYDVMVERCGASQTSGPNQ